MKNATWGSDWLRTGSDTLGGFGRKVVVLLTGGRNDKAMMGRGVTNAGRLMVGELIVDGPGSGNRGLATKSGKVMAAPFTGPSSGKNEPCYGLISFSDPCLPRSAPVEVSSFLYNHRSVTHDGCRSQTNRDSRNRRRYAPDIRSENGMAVAWRPSHRLRFTSRPKRK
jgi:hypothetical protein